MVTIQQMIDTARKYVGVKEEPANSNNVIFNTRYYGHAVSGSAYPWCCTFIVEVSKETGLSLKKTALCADLANWFKSKNRFYASNPQVGDVVFFKFSSGSKNYTNHVGLVVAVNNGSITTIEGNTGTGNDANGGMVMERIRTYPSSNIVGFGRPEYSSASALKPTLATLSYPCRGIDVSAYQSNIDYLACRNDGIRFAVLKIIRKDLGVDKMFENHYKGFTNAGIPVVGVYNYSYATTVDKAQTDAKKVIELLKNRKITVCLDVEDNVQKGLGKQLINIINAYGDVIGSQGLPFVVYTGLSFFNSYIKPYLSSLKYKDFWIARYYRGYEKMSVNYNVDERYKPNVSGVSVIGWQFTSSGQVSNYNGTVDLNVLYSAFGRLKHNTAADYKDISNNTVFGCNSLNVRNKPKTGAVVGRISAGTKVKVYDIDYSTGWYCIDENKQKWISNQYVRTTTVTRLKKGTSALNYRNSDSKDGKVLGVYSANDIISIIGRSERTGWYLTDKGWISDQYVNI